MNLFGIDEAIERIMLMERCFDALQSADIAAVKADGSLKEQLRLLTQYYQGGSGCMTTSLMKRGCSRVI